MHIASISHDNAEWYILFSRKPVMQIAVRLITGNPLYMLVHAEVEFKVLSIPV